MELKYDINIDDSVIDNRIKILINQIYKLLPSRQEGSDWQKPLETIMIQLSGMQRLLNRGNPNLYFRLLCKLEGLYSLDKDENFVQYRRTIFECLNLMDIIKKEICLQNY